MSSDEDGATLMAAFKKKGTRKAVSPPRTEVEATRVEDSVSDNTVEAEEAEAEKEPTPKLPPTRRAVCVRVKPVSNRDDYVYYDPVEEVEEIVKEYSRKGDMLYEVRVTGNIKKQVSVAGKGRPTETFGSGKDTVVAAIAPGTVYLYKQLSSFSIAPCETSFTTV
jgi:chromodomain-helicase-DNA-binding protein 4